MAQSKAQQEAQARQAKEDTQKKPVAVGERGGVYELRGGQEPGKGSTGPTSTKDGSEPTEGRGGADENDIDADQATTPAIGEDNETDNSHDEPRSGVDSEMDGRDGRPYDATQEPVQQEPPMREGQNPPTGH